jgi:hypothetical protein
MIIDNCPQIANIPQQNVLFSFQPIECGEFYNECGELIKCNPLDACIDSVNGGFVKKNWMRHVVYAIINSDSQDKSCGYGVRRGAPSDGFVSLKHGNSLWNNKKIGLSREVIKDYIATLTTDLKEKLKSLGLDLNVSVSYKMTGAYNYDLNIMINDESYNLTRDTRNTYYNWAK